MKLKVIFGTSNVNKKLLERYENMRNPPPRVIF